MKKQLGVAEAKKHFSEVLENIVYREERFVILKRGKPVAAMISMKELAELEKCRALNQKGLIVAAGAWADYENIDELIKDIYSSRISAKDREVSLE